MEEFLAPIPIVLLAIQTKPIPHYSPHLAAHLHFEQFPVIPQFLALDPQHFPPQVVKFVLRLLFLHWAKLYFSSLSCLLPYRP
jgi:hypothetical protein